MPKIVNNLDAQGIFRITDLPNPINSGDSVNKVYVDTFNSYTHIQSVSDTIWLVNHNLGYYPNVRVKDSSGRFILTDIEDIDINNLYVKNSAAFGGIAYCS